MRSIRANRGLVLSVQLKAHAVCSSSSISVGQRLATTSDSRATDLDSPHPDVTSLVFSIDRLRADFTRRTAVERKILPTQYLAMCLYPVRWSSPVRHRSASREPCTSPEPNTVQVGEPGGRDPVRRIKWRPMRQRSMYRRPSLPLRFHRK